MKTEVNQSPTSAADPMLLTVPEAAEMLRISRWGLYSLINSRQLKTIKIGSRRLIPREAVTSLVQRLGDEENL